MSVPPPVPGPVFTGPTCLCCGSPAVLNWARRLSGDEMSALLAHEQELRDRITAAAPLGREPVFGPLPTSEESVKIVHACAAHSITVDLASLVHRSTCTAPTEASLPGCDCTPEGVDTGPADEPTEPADDEPATD